MDRAKPARKPNASTADLLTWSEVPPAISPASSLNIRSHQPSDGFKKVVFGGQVTEEESESLMKRKPCSGNKMKEMTGSGIFTDSRPSAGPASATKTGYRQALNGISQISFSTEEDVTPKKPITVAEVAKQRELSGNLQSELDSKVAKRQTSDAKSKELSGHNIFSSAPDNPHRSPAFARTLVTRERKDFEQPAQRNVRTSVKVSNPSGGHTNNLFGEDQTAVQRTTKKVHNQKCQELTGKNIFKGGNETPPPLNSAEKPVLSPAKMREISGSNNIFSGGSGSGGKIETQRDYFGGVRKPPGGESSISLV